VNDTICKEHTGCVADIRHLEGDVKALWDKWDGMQKMLIGTMVSGAFTLIGVVVLILRTYVR
jgi:hypothetical protein